MPLITVTAKADFGYHPASGQYLYQGEKYTIEEDAFSEELFDRDPAAPETASEEPAAPAAALEVEEN